MILYAVQHPNMSEALLIEASPARRNESRMSYPTMTTKVVRHDRDNVDIIVFHDVRQSCSRSVLPRAMKEAKRVLRDGRQWEAYGDDFDTDHSDPNNPRRTTTTSHFRVSR